MGIDSILYLSLVVVVSRRINGDSDSQPGNQALHVNYISIVNKEREWGSTGPWGKTSLQGNWQTAAGWGLRQA